MKVALVHDWLIHMRGGEKVLEALAELYPDATIHTLFYDRSRLSPVLRRMPIKATMLQHFPGIRHYYRWLLPFFPSLIRSLNVGDVDLVISSSHCVAKGVRVPPGVRHVCYCHTPMRYAWGFEEEYFGKFPFVLKPFIRSILQRLREWDLLANARVDQFVANSENVRRRIRQFYDRDAGVIHPPVNTERYRPGPSRGDYYLVVSAFVPYKRVDLAVSAFNHFGRKLLIVGSGPLEKELKKMRRTDNIFFLGTRTQSDLRHLYARALALLFPTEEDFGIVPVEAQAAGTPVIAYGRGGALEGVRSGLFFSDQTPESLRQAVLKFESMQFDRSHVSRLVSSFGKARFLTQVRDALFAESPAPEAVHA